MELPDISVYEKAASRLLGGIAERIRTFDNPSLAEREAFFLKIKEETQSIIESFLEVIKPYSRGGTREAFLLGEPTILDTKVWPPLCLEEYWRAANAFQEALRQHRLLV
ncbi:MAG: hypothetical protein AAB375_00690 [Patescibacteria group bacterium]